MFEVLKRAVCTAVSCLTVSPTNGQSILIGAFSD